jgi:hypothetical protein
MRAKDAFRVLTALTILLGTAAGAESPLAARGTYQAHFWWQEHGEWFEVENGHRFFAGKFTGTFFNDAGSGFLHRASAVCPGVLDNFKDSASGHGYCVITDEDADQATLVWRCGSAREPRCQERAAEWAGGTGKYSGLKGSQRFSVVLRSTGNEGFAVFKGEWRLPE